MKLRTLAALLLGVFAPLCAFAAPVITGTVTVPTSLTQGDTKDTLFLVGRNFGAKGQVLVNGTPIPTTIYSQDLIWATIPTVGKYVNVQVVDGKGEASLTVNVAVNAPKLTTPTITWPTPASVPFGTVVTSVQLNATASVPGTFAYKPAFGTPLSAGTQTLTASFTPTDTTKYTTATAQVSLTVTQAKPTISWAAPASITTTTALSSAQLNATASIPGTFAYSPAAGATLSQGTQTITATFTPADATDYASATASVQIQVTAPTQPTSPTSPVTPSGGGQTWYIRADGGGRYSASRVAAGQGDAFAGCDGLADAPYPGKGTNQHCAFNDVRLLWDAQTDYATTKWVIAGGDTVIIDSTKQWRIGSDYGQGTSNWPVFGWGSPNGIYGMVNPTIPAGTAQQHTRILGRNYGACSVGNDPDKTKMTQIFGGYGLWNTLNLAGTQYVDVQCLEITSHSACTVHGSPAMPKACATSTFPLDDYDGSGISTDLGTANINLQDLWVHGHTDRGIKGALGGLVTATRVDIAVNGMAGWDLDPGDGTTSPNGAITMKHSTIEFSGCDQVWPDTRPTYCYGQSSGGYGDAMGTPPGPIGAIDMEDDLFRFNTQDAPDFGHVYDAPGLIYLRNQSYANNGGQFKFAGFENIVAENNLILGNCMRMSQPIPGIPSTFNQYLADYCRAGDLLSFDLNDGGQALIANNTIVGYEMTLADVQCYTASGCPKAVLTFENNIAYGIDNPATYSIGGQQGGIGDWCLTSCNGSANPIGTIIRANNIYGGAFRHGCPAIGNERCADPDFVNEPAFSGESSLDGFNFTIGTGSPASLSGMEIPGLTSDFLGNAYQTPSIGALAPGSAYSLPLQ